MIPTSICLELQCRWVPLSWVLEKRALSDACKDVAQTSTHCESQNLGFCKLHSLSRCPLLEHLVQCMWLRACAAAIGSQAKACEMITKSFLGLDRQSLWNGWYCGGAAPPGSSTGVRVRGERLDKGSPMVQLRDVRVIAQILP
jgi:hypothetical protein